jgi:hypothetical protein
MLDGDWSSDVCSSDLLDQIGTIMGEPDEEPHASAYQGALEGEVAIIRFG